MYTFPEGVYTDLRVEDNFESHIQITMNNLDEFRVKNDTAVFIRMFDGRRWYYASLTELDNVQENIDRLFGLTSPQNNVNSHPAIQKLQVNKGTCLRFTKRKSVREEPKNNKLDLLKGYTPVIDGKPHVKMWRANYVDQNVVKHFLSSLGADITFDTQKAGFRVMFELAEGEKNLREHFDKASNFYADLNNLKNDLQDRYNEAVCFFLNAREMEPGQYPVILSPEAAGVFAHESFGHKSEADFMLGDETMRKEWLLGKEVGARMLSIVDDGNQLGAGYVPFDDEGTKAVKTYLLKNGILAGRLHSSITASDLEEDLTGNARAKNFEYEPVVRMTTTYIEPGEQTFEQLLSGIKQGVFVKTIKHGSGMSTFTLAPSLAYMIREGQLDGPVNISVVSGNVFKTLGDIDGLSNKLELLSFTLGGCGKMEQFPLSVGFGGPYVRVRKLDVR